MRIKMRSSRYLVVLCLACFPAFFGPVFAQTEITVNAAVNQTEIGLQETVIYTVEIRAQGTISNVYPPQPPESRNLTLVQAAPSTAQSSFFSSSTNQLEQSISFTWYFRPVEVGDASIARTAVVIGEKTFSTQPISLTVTAEPQNGNRSRATSPTLRPRGRSMFDNPFSDPDDSQLESEGFGATDFFIRTYPNARSVYQNQQMAVDYFLFVRRGIEIRNSRLADSWDAEGFWREEMDVAHDTQVEVIDGIPYRKILLKRIVIFPTRAGTLRIDPLEIQGDASRTRTGSPFGTYLRRPTLETEEITIRSPAVTIESKALPEPAPENFSGAVGALEMDAQMDRDRVEVGETITLTIRLSGRGNIATLSAPRLELPTMLERYEPTVIDRINRAGNVVSGYKTFTYVIVPRSNGTYEIPALTYSYFDAGSSAYQTLTSNPFSITVTGTAEPARTTLTHTFPPDDIASLITSRTRWRSASNLLFHETWWPPLLLLLPLVLLGGLVLLRKHTDRMTHDVEFARGRKASALAKRHLREARQLMQHHQVKEFYEEIARALLSFVGNRLNVSELGLTYEQLDELLVDRQVPGELRQQLKNLLTECDLVRYAPVQQSAARMSQVLDMAGHFLNEIDSHLPQPKARTVRTS